MTARSVRAGSRQWPGVTTSEERNGSVGARIGSFLAAYVALGLLAPLLVMLLKGGASPFVRRHAVESLHFQITTLIVVVPGSCSDS